MAKPGRKRGLRVCFKLSPARGGYKVQLRDLKTGAFRDWLGAPCLRVKRKAKGQLFLIRAAAVQGARDCDLKRSCPL